MVLRCELAVVGAVSAPFSGRGRGALRAGGADFRRTTCLQWPTATCRWCGCRAKAPCGVFPHCLHAAALQDEGEAYRLGAGDEEFRDFSSLQLKPDHFNRCAAGRELCGSGAAGRGADSGKRRFGQGGAACSAATCLPVTTSRRNRAAPQAAVGVPRRARLPGNLQPRVQAGALRWAAQPPASPLLQSGGLGRSSAAGQDGHGRSAGTCF